MTQTQRETRCVLIWLFAFAFWSVGIITLVAGVVDMLTHHPDLWMAGLIACLALWVLLGLPLHKSIEQYAHPPHWKRH